MPRRAAPPPSRNTPRPAARPATRPRGRPPAAPETQALIRQRLLDATRAVFTRVGYHALSVELVLAEAGLSRPTFYKHFRNTDEPIDLVIGDVNDKLVGRLLGAVGAAPEPFAAIEAGLVAWRDWGTELGPMLKPLFAELHDAHSPASRHRLRVLAILSRELVALVTRFGRPAPTALQVDALLNGMEYLGYRFQLQTPRDEQSWKQTRDMMMRLALALLGARGEWSHAVQLADAMAIDLAPRD